MTEPALTLANAEDWIEDLLNRIEAHYMRVERHLKIEGIDFAGWTVADLQEHHAAEWCDWYPEWCAAGFLELGWPAEMPISEGVKGCDFEPEDLAIERVPIDFRDRYRDVSAAWEEIASIYAVPDWHIPQDSSTDG